MIRILAFATVALILIKLIARTFRTMDRFTNEGQHSKGAILTIRVLTCCMVTSVNSMAFATLNVVLLHYGM